MINNFLTIKNLAMLFVILALTGCAVAIPVTGQRELMHARSLQTPPIDKARIYIYKDTASAYNGVVHIWMDGKCLGQSSSELFYSVTVVGNVTHTISVGSGNSLVLYTKVGMNYFISENSDHSLTQMDDSVGKRKIQSLNMGVIGSCKQ